MKDISCLHCNRLFTRGAANQSHDSFFICPKCFQMNEIHGTDGVSLWKPNPDKSIYDEYDLACKAEGDGNGTVASQPDSVQIDRGTK